MAELRRPPHECRQPSRQRHVPVSAALSGERRAALLFALFIYRPWNSLLLLRYWLFVRAKATAATPERSAGLSLLPEKLADDYFVVKAVVSRRRTLAPFLFILSHLQVDARFCFSGRFFVSAVLFFFPGRGIYMYNTMPPHLSLARAVLFPFALSAVASDCCENRGFWESG